MPKKYNTVVSEILNALKDSTQLIPLPLETPYAWVKRTRKMPYKDYYNELQHLKRRNLIVISKKNKRQFIQLTKKGNLELLLSKANIQKVSKWDGKWRMVIFDIPETHKKFRDNLRGLLKRNNFTKLQASVFINPYPLNREAISYLRETGLINFIRILRIDEIDNDKYLKVKYKLR